MLSSCTHIYVRYGLQDNLLNTLTFVILNHKTKIYLPDGLPLTELLRINLLGELARQEVILLRTFFAEDHLLKI